MFPTYQKNLYNDEQKGRTKSYSSTYNKLDDERTKVTIFSKTLSWTGVVNVQSYLLKCLASTNIDRKWPSIIYSRRKKRPVKNADVVLVFSCNFIAQHTRLSYKQKDNKRP